MQTFIRIWVKESQEIFLNKLSMLACPMQPWLHDILALNGTLFLELFWVSTFKWKGSRSIDAFTIEVWWNFDKMQIIFKALTGSSVTPLGGKESAALYGREKNLLQKTTEVVAALGSSLLGSVYGTLAYRSRYVV